MGTPDSREYDRLVERGFKPYSKGHRMMYEKAIADMKTRGYGRVHDEVTGARILEAGFGIGWGLDRMAEEKVFTKYVGYEPNVDSFNYVRGRYPEAASVAHDEMADAGTWGSSDILLLNRGYRETLWRPDVTFCIEVIEHVPALDHLTFLRGLHNMAPVLYFSTPDIRKVPSEGVRTRDEWLALLAEAGFSAVLYDESNWTTFYRASR